MTQRMAIRIPSEVRQVVEQEARARKVTPSELYRAYIIRGIVATGRYPHISPDTVQVGKPGRPKKR